MKMATLTVIEYVDMEGNEHFILARSCITQSFDMGMIEDTKLMTREMQR